MGRSQLSIENCEDPTKGLSESELDVLCVLLNSGASFVAVGDVADTLGWDGERASEVLLLLDLAGYLEYWEREEGISFTLSPWGASRLKMRLADFNGESIWVCEGDPDPPQPRAKNVTHEENRLHLVEDELPGPLLQAILQEEFVVPLKPTKKVAGLHWVGQRKLDCNGLPLPTVFVHRGPMTPYIEGLCDSCGGEDLQPYMYCLKCDRWGCDGKYEMGKYFRMIPEVKLQQQKEARKGNLKEKVKNKVKDMKEKAREKRRQLEEKRMRQGVSRVRRKVA